MAFKWDRTDPPEFYQEIKSLAMSGLSLKECGDFFGLDPDDWIEWCEYHPLTENRWNQGRAIGVALAGQKLIEQIRAGKINAVTFYLKTQGGFTEKQIMRLEESLKVVHPPPPPIPTDPTEAARVYQQFMKDS